MVIIVHLNQNSKNLLIVGIVLSLTHEVDCIAHPAIYVLLNDHFSAILVKQILFMRAVFRSTFRIQVSINFCKLVISLAYSEIRQTQPRLLLCRILFWIALYALQLNLFWGKIL
jgi:hypothetical protein